MRRVSPLVPLVAVVLLGLLVAARPAAHATAQEGTPSPEGVAVEGVTVEALAFAPAVALPSLGDVIVVRLGLEPGVVQRFEPGRQASGLLIVEAGELTVRLEAPLAVSRAESIATAAAMGASEPPTETVAAGEAVTLRVGDAVFFPADVGGEIRNDGQERVEGLFFVVVPGEAAMPTVGTPAP